MLNVEGACRAQLRCVNAITHLLTRLKLRCDKEIPCGSCQRRNCADACPHGESLYFSHGHVLTQTREYY